MASITIEDFKYGMDRRRQRVAGTPGTLWLGKNVHITRGGDVERAKKFVSTYSLPAGKTFGLGQVRGQLYTFGSLAAASVAVPLGVQYQRLQASDTAATMVEVLDVDKFDGALYVIARFDNGEIHHFYDGTLIADWSTIAAAAADVNVLTAYLADLVDADAAVSALAVEDVITVTARVPGTAFTIAKATVDLGGTSDQDITLATVQANVAEVDEVQATSLVEVIAGSTGTVQDITANAVSLMRAAVTWATSHTATAAAIAVQINNKTATHGYTAEASGAQITITAAPGTGATPNGYAVASSVTGDVVLSTPSMSGGIDAVEPVAQVVTATISGTFQALDLYTLTINGTDYRATGRAAATGTSAFVHKKRMWSPANSLWDYSQLNDATDWTNADVSSGAGSIRLSLETEGSERLIGAAPYGTQAAIFSRNSVHTFSISTDAEENQIGTTLGNTGSLSGRAITPYGNLDVFYLDEPGIRSLKAHEQTGEAFAGDIGNPVDSFVRAYMDTLTEAQIRRAVSTIGTEGRFWLALGERIFVLSYFPGSRISAWSFYEPGFEVSDFVRIRNKVYARAGDTVYLYGGAAGTTYPDDDELDAEVELPFITGAQPAVKEMQGFDIACTGEWEIKALVDPNNEAKTLNLGRVADVTYSRAGHIALPGEAALVAFRLVCSNGGAASISKMTLYYAPVETK
jgi:hypothetical protein